MKIGKILLLVSVALAAVAFAMPATASATPATILDKGAIIKNDPTITFTGTGIKYEALGSGMECSVTAKITVQEDIAELTAFEINTPTCVFFGNPFKNCKFEEPPVQGDTVEGLPWVLDPEIVGSSRRLTLTASTAGLARIELRLTDKVPPAKCFTTQNIVELTHDPAKGLGVTLAVGTVNGFIDSLQLGGNIQIVNALGTSVAATKGTLVIEPADTATYAFG